jgi:hypothetical protein
MIAGAFGSRLVILLLIRQGAMDLVSEDSDVARTIAARNEQMWQAYLEKNVVAHNAILSDDYTSIHPDGSLHDGPPSAAAIASAPIAAFRFSQFLVSRLAEDAVLATYVADVDTPPGTQPVHVRFAAGTVWVKRRGEWKCRFYQGTTVANETSTN